MNDLKLILGWNWILGTVSILSGTLLGYLFGGFIVPRLVEALTKDKLDKKHPLYLALLSFVRFSFFLFGVYAALRFADLDKESKENFLLYLKVFAIILMTFSLARIGSGAFALYSSKAEGLLPSASILNNIVRILILMTGGLVALQTLGISVTPALTALGVGGLAFALGLQETLSNLFAGLGVLLGKKVRVGDYICLETGEEGRVEDINWRTTTLKKLNGSTIIIPNAKMSKTTYTNFSLQNSGLWTGFDLSVPLGTDTERLSRLLIETAKTSLEQYYGKNQTPKGDPEILFKSIDSSNIDLSVNVRILHITDSNKIRSFFIKFLHSRFQSEDIRVTASSSPKTKGEEGE